MAEDRSPTTSGIYVITHVGSGRVYVGSSKNIDRRLYLHRWQLKKKIHHSITLQRAWNKYGSDCFTFTVALLCGEANLLFYEQVFIDFYRSSEACRGFNISPIAGRSCRSWTDEQRQNSSIARLGKPVFKNCPEAYARLKANAKRGDQHPMHGKKHSEESRRKISAALKGRVAHNRGKTSPMKGILRPRSVSARVTACRRLGRGIRLSMEIARDCRRRHASGESAYQIAKSLGVCSGTVEAVVRNRTWRESAA